MIASTSGVAVAALMLLSSATSAQIVHSGTWKGSPRSYTLKGCFDSAQPMKFHGSYRYFQTPGNCQNVCYGMGYAVMGMTNGDECWCGNQLPSKDSQVDNSRCSTDCPGYPQVKCGGSNVWTVYLTGQSLNSVPYFQGDQTSSPSSSSSSSKMSLTTTKAVSTSAGSVIYETVTTSLHSSQSNSAAGNNSSAGSTNTTGIAVGVVVGVVALIAIIAGVYFFLRRKKAREQEEKEKQQEIINSFVEGGKTPGTSHSSMNDSRLDPELVRRQSDGSIADNQDFSRRILQVTNPDGY